MHEESFEQGRIDEWGQPGIGGTGMRSESRSQRKELLTSDDAEDDSDFDPESSETKSAIDSEAANFQMMGCALPFSIDCILHFLIHPSDSIYPLFEAYPSCRERLKAGYEIEAPRRCVRAWYCFHCLCKHVRFRSTCYHLKLGLAYLLSSCLYIMLRQIYHHST